MKITDDRIREIEAADEHAPGGMGLPYVSELLAERKELEKMIERLRVQVERLEGRVDEPCDGCAEKALEAVREWTDDPPATLGNTVYLACQAMVRAILDGEVE